MILKSFLSGILSNNNYLLIDEIAKEAILIDCTRNKLEFKHILNQYGAKLKYVLLTHGHFDHILDLNSLKEDFPEAIICLHKDDMELVKNINQFLNRFGMEDVDIPKIDKYIDESDVFFLGKNEIKVIHTPGHTKGGVCYLIQDKLFSGDTIFFESIGRTDLDGGDLSELINSIKNKLFTLNETIEIYPGHGEYSTIAHEKQCNQYII